MSSTFGGIELGKRALQAQQRSLEVTGHNIANANNYKYSRQRAIQSATTPFAAPNLYNSTGSGQIGTGVYIEKIQRVRDQFVDKKIRYENHALGEWSVKKENLQYIEGIFNELDSGGMTANLDQFFDSFQELNNNPESMAVRESVVQKTISLTKQFNHFNNGLEEHRKNLGQEIVGRVDQFNYLTEKVANLNNQIKSVESDPDKSANDLMDERDAVLDELSKLADINYKVDSTNQVNISLNGINVVQGKRNNELSFNKVSETRTSTDGQTYNFDIYEFEVNGNEVDINSGEMKGFIDNREDIIDYKINRLDYLARELRDQVNTLHNQGFGLKDDVKRDFFTGNDASDLAVNQDIIDDSGHIAAAGDGVAFEDKNGDNIRDNAGDGSNALAIANLRENGNIDGTGFNDFWQRQSSDLGVKIQSADQMKNNQEVLLGNLVQKREAVSGVSLDEEMAEMIKFQHGYNGAAKVISKLDEMVNTLINGILK